MQATPCGLVTVVGRERPVEPSVHGGFQHMRAGCAQMKDANPSNASISVSDSNANNADLKRTHGNSTLNTYNKEFPVDNFRSL